MATNNENLWTEHTLLLAEALAKHHDQAYAAQREIGEIAVRLTRQATQSAEELNRVIWNAAIVQYAIETKSNSTPKLLRDLVDTFLSTPPRVDS